MGQRWWRKRLGQTLILLGALLVSPICARSYAANTLPQKTIVVGFVGGFVRDNDAKHAEVRFARQLRARYASAVDVQVFGNHARDKALRHVLNLLDTNGDGRLTADEKERARIIIFGHSWGGTATVVLARELGQRQIPVLLTIQVDTIGKPGEKSVTIPPNVAKAVNFYQANGLLHGRPDIFAMDPSRTDILGNFEMSYKDHPIRCDQFPWYARFFTKPHIEIENDPRVWAQAASLIDREVSAL
jgi:hypothetical protein